MTVGANSRWRHPRIVAEPATGMTRKPKACRDCRTPIISRRTRCASCSPRWSKHRAKEVRKQHELQKEASKIRTRRLPSLQAAEASGMREGQEA